MPGMEREVQDAPPLFVTAAVNATPNTPLTVLCSPCSATATARSGCAGLAATDDCSMTSDCPPGGVCVVCRAIWATDRTRAPVGGEAWAEVAGTMAAQAAMVSKING